MTREEQERHADGPRARMNVTWCGCNTRELDHGHRRRSRAECQHDLLLACRHLGAIAAASEIALQPPDVGDVERTTTGLQRVLVELRAQGGDA